MNEEIPLWIYSMSISSDYSEFKCKTQIIRYLNEYVIDNPDKIVYSIDDYYKKYINIMIEYSKRNNDNGYIYIDIFRKIRKIFIREMLLKLMCNGKINYNELLNKYNYLVLEDIEKID